MKNLNQTRQSEQFASYLSGELSESESKDLLDKRLVSEEDIIELEKMKKYWTDIKNLKQPQVPDTGKAWEKLHERLLADKLVPMQAEPRTRRAAVSLARLAAVLIILLGVAAVVYNALQRSVRTEMVQLNTANDANTLIKTLADGSVIYIAQNSVFSFPKAFETQSRNVSLKGEAFFDIAPNPEKPFVIETDVARIEVLGTAFNVNDHNGKSFELCVDRGKVKVTLKSDPAHPALVVAGEKVNVMRNNLVKSEYAVNSASGWCKQRMHFKDETLKNIISVLNRNFNTTFVVPETQTGNRKLTVTFNRETEATMTELICLTLNLKSQKINGSVVLYENQPGVVHK